MEETPIFLFANAQAYLLENVHMCVCTSSKRSNVFLTNDKRNCPLAHEHLTPLRLTWHRETLPHISPQPHTSSESYQYLIKYLLLQPRSARKISFPSCCLEPRVNTIFLPFLHTKNHDLLPNTKKESRCFEVHQSVLWA